jgi:ribosome biogenesis GTPase
MSASFPEESALSAQFHSRLAALGWEPWFEERFARFAADGLAPARVTADFGAEYAVTDGSGQRRAVASRGVREAGLPAVGDWVALLDRQPVPAIQAVLDRRTAFSRKVAGRETSEQVLAANVDVAFVVASSQDVDSRRIERYLTMAWQSGASPVIVLTKSDLLGSTEEVLAELEAVAAGTPVLATSSVTGEGVDAISAQLVPARTGVLLGPSGVGKSTLINCLVGNEVMRTKDVYRTGEGRHMTSHRQLVELPAGGMIIDTPGLREAQLWASDDDALGTLFDEIEALALRCRFPDCEHRSEPGCAIKVALLDGTLDEGRLASYRKLQRELRSVAARSDARLRADERRKWRQITMANRARERYLRR